MPMKSPPHPGRSIRTACLEPLGLSTAEGAKILGVTRQALNNVISGKSAVTPEMAIRLTKAFGSSAETWLQMQMAYDLAKARKSESQIHIARIKEFRGGAVSGEIRFKAEKTKIKDAASKNPRLDPVHV
jgi:addiction module HigA family antidote